MGPDPKDEEAIFNAALDIASPDKRAAYIRDVCSGDDSLQARIEALVEVHGRECSLLEQAASSLKVTLDALPLAEAPGTKIGRYDLLELIGEGGMGLVYLAQQQEPKRKVALKIVKLGMDTKQVVARFEAERQTLALLTHPNIAHVFDAGTTDTGRPYFVMEYVQGKSITKYCDEQKLSIEQRLELFQQICEGVHHAHQKGIIHRDLKPSNILVSVHGDRAVPKIIDFGIAKAITQPLLTEKTSYTEHGQLLGTPEYMSPEQAEMATEDIDTRSDIYSLGVLLYELLAGATPFDAKRLRKGGIDGIQQVICQEEPRTPSARLTSLGDKAEAIAERRRTQIITLTRRLHRELEWIPMKAMRKDRTRRYRSASELSDDIQNYLTGMPLIAGPESNVYRARKFVHKHAGFVASAALVALVIVIGLITSTAFSFSAEKARGQEAAARVEAEEARDKEAALRVQVEQALARAEQAEKVAKEQRKLAEEQRSLAEERAEQYRQSLYFNSIVLADKAYHDGNMQRLGELLESCPEDLRAWEWYHMNQVSGQSSMIIRRHSGPVYPAGFSPDGKRIVSAWGKTIKVWDAATGAEVMDLHGHEALVMSAMFSPDGKRIVSAGNDKTIRIWDAATGTPLMTLRGHEADVTACLSPDGKRIVSGCADGTIKLWDATSGAELMTIRGHDDAVGVVRFSPDGKQIVSVSMDRTKVWDTTLGTKLSEHNGPGIFSPDGKWICMVGGSDGTVKVCDAASRTEVITLRGHKSPVFAAVFSPDGKRIATGSLDRSIKLWDAVSGSELVTLQGHQSVITMVSFSPDGQRIVSCSVDGTVRVWNTSGNRNQRILHGSHHSVFSPDSQRLVSAGRNDNTIKVTDVATGTERMTLSGHTGRVWSVAFSPDGKRIVSGSFDKTLRVWDAVTGKSLMILRGHSDRVWSVAYSPDGNRIISGSYDGTVRVWDAEKGTEIKSLTGHNARIETVAFSPDGKKIASGSWDKTVKVWDAETGDERMTLVGHKAGIAAVTFSPDGTRIISGTSDRSVKVWDVETGDEIMTLDEHKHWVRSVAVSPDGKRIVSSCGDTVQDSGDNSEMKIWDLITGTELMTLRSTNLRSIAFSPDGHTIAIDSHNGVTLLESKMPADGYESRRTGTAARTVVDELHSEYQHYSKVIEKLKADNTLEEPVRKIALQIGHARLWKDAEEQKEAEK
jgi:eukaryotic-like serine/threonine-protein kinase